MAKEAKKAIEGEVQPPDFEKAMSVYTNDIVPANTEQKRAMQEASHAWKMVRKEYRVHKSGFQAAMKLCDAEDVEGQAWARSFMAGLRLRGFHIHADLADMAQGITAQDAIIPTQKRVKVEMMRAN